ALALDRGRGARRFVPDHRALLRRVALEAIAGADRAASREAPVEGVPVLDRVLAVAPAEVHGLAAVPAPEVAEAVETLHLETHFGDAVERGADPARHHVGLRLAPADRLGGVRIDLDGSLVAEREALLCELARERSQDLDVLPHLPKDFGEARDEGVRGREREVVLDIQHARILARARVGGPAPPARREPPLPAARPVW